jgi:peptide/nickel transport system substrate-binding protein
LATCGAVAVGVALAAAVLSRRSPALPEQTSAHPPAAGGVATGGALVVSVRTEPQSFNPFTKRDSTTDLISTFINAKLVRINRATAELEPWLAERWTRSDDGTRYTMSLRSGVTFADGHPFTADDVVFTFKVLYDAKTANALADALKPGGKPLTATAVDAQTVVITFPEPFAPGLRLLDILPMLPRHRLEAALHAGTFADTWSLATPLEEIAGLGPFTLAEYVPGQRTVLARNPRYFRKDEHGAALPYLDRVTIEVVTDQNAELLRLEAGDLDLTSSEVRPEDYAPLKRAADAGRVQLLDLGVGYDVSSFWVNLTPGGLAGRAGTEKRATDDLRERWVQRDELRHAISHAVDRQAFADVVYLGAGVPVYGPLTPANQTWFSSAVPQTSHDPTRAQALLASLGLVDRNGDRLLDDPQGQTARLTVLTQKGRTALERGAAVIRDEMAKIGLTIDVVALDGAALIQKFLSGRDFDAVYFSVSTSDTDPALNADFWMSTGYAHVWRLHQTQPATEWERQIDELMTRLMRTFDERERRSAFDRVQVLFAEHLPMVHFVAPKVFAVASSRVANVTPALSRPQLLWSPDTIAARRSLKPGP